jgi:hypothetical protein
MLTCGLAPPSVAEMDENPAEVFVVFLEPVVEFLYVRLSEEA